MLEKKGQRFLLHRSSSTIIEVVPNYQSRLGRPLRTRVVISLEEDNCCHCSTSKPRLSTNSSPLNVYDGPYSTIPLLLSHRGSTKPPSIRSLSNTLYVEFPSYYYNQSYSVYYTSMPNTGIPFIPGT
ncbi:hypothetical protein OUZ56_020089 [Daphnia magna]|uniref:Uncharacterized protein n=1 Tax=Daphnia magna TaxID=35525 RepID=A0ABQ9ZDI9_9CRUS|nr:hypothetical protein OUZ56_020089 [Daphnia magna]